MLTIITAEYRGRRVLVMEARRRPWPVRVRDPETGQDSLAAREELTQLHFYHFIGSGGEVS